MKLHQSGDKIIVTELRPMSELREREFALCYGHVNLGRYGDLEKYQKWGMRLVDINGDEYDIDRFIGWIPMPIYQPEKS